MKRPRWLSCEQASQLLFGVLLSGTMSLIVSGIATVRVLGLTPGMPQQWFASWLAAWAVALPVVLVVAPRVRRITGRVVAGLFPECR